MSAQIIPFPPRGTAANRAVGENRDAPSCDDEERYQRMAASFDKFLVRRGIVTQEQMDANPRVDPPKPRR